MALTRHVLPPPGVSKIVTVDVKGSSPLWLKVKDLAEGMTYRFRIRAKTFTYGPEIEANVTTGPGEGRGALDGCGGPPGRKGASRACIGGAKFFFSFFIYLFFGVQS